MKLKLISFSLIGLISYVSFGQWTGATSSTDINSNVYRQGSVGIGTTNPLAKLQIDPQGAGGILIGGNSTPQIQLFMGISESYPNINSYVELSSRIVNNVQTSRPLVLNRLGGNIGIGVTNPSSTLTLPNGNAKISLGDNIFINGEGSNGRITNNAYVLNGNWIIPDATAKAVTIELRDNGVIDMYGTTTNGQTNWKQMLGIDAPNNKVIFPNGNVGIGSTTNPQTKLHIQNDVNGWAQTIKGASSSVNDFVGIKFKTGYNGEENLETKWTGIASVVESLHGNTNGLALYTGQAEKMRITYEGKIGIGIVSPQAQLHLADVYSAGGKNLLIGDDVFLSDIDQSDILGIYGNANSDRSGIKLGSNGPLIYGGSNGSLGIGTMNPGAFLTIDPHPANDSWATSMFFGNPALPVGGTNINIGLSMYKNGYTFIQGTQSYGSNYGSLKLQPNGGDVVIGAQKVTETDARLSVDGTIYARKLKIVSSFADYVFEKEYKLLDIYTLENYIIKNKHLPNMPTSCEIEDSGMDISQVVLLQMEKIEELSLYIIELKKEIDQIKK